MPETSHPDGSLRRRWALQIPTQISGNQPEWLTTSFGLGYIGIGHAVQAKFGIDGTVASLALYGLCVALGVVTGKVVRRLMDGLVKRGIKADRLPRIVGTFIVLGGWVVGQLPGTSAVPAAAHLWTAQWLWIGAGALLILLAAAGEALACWFPAAKPAPPLPAPPIRRRSWWRLGPDTA